MAMFGRIVPVFGSFFEESFWPEPFTLTSVTFGSVALVDSMTLSTAGEASFRSLATTGKFSGFFKGATFNDFSCAFSSVEVSQG